MSTQTKLVQIKKKLAKLCGIRLLSYILFH